MKRFVIAAAFAAMAFSVAARAEDTVDSLKPQTLEACKKEVGDGTPNAEVDKLCGCMVDNIVTVFGDDAVKMLKVIAAGLSPSQVPEIAAALGISEADAKAFIEVADQKMDKVQEACMPAETAPKP